MSGQYLFAQESVRFEWRAGDVLAVPAQLQVNGDSARVRLSLGNAHVEIDATHASLEQCRELISSIDGKRTLESILRQPGIQASAADALLRSAFGRVIFAPFAVTALEHRLSGIEIVRFPGVPYEIVRSYWENQIDLARVIEHEIESLCEPQQFLSKLRHLHVTLLTGKDQQSIYTPASPIARKGVQPGELLDSPVRFLDTPHGPVLVAGAKVSAALLGGEIYQRLVCDSVRDSDAVRSDRVVQGEDGLQWGRLVTARVGDDPLPSPLFIPPRPFRDEYFTALAQSLASAWQAVQREELAKVVRSLATFHQRFVRLHPFQCANQSLAMALVNFVLRASHGAGIPHLVLDHFALRLNENSYAELFARAVKHHLIADLPPVQRYQLLRERKQRSYSLISQLATAQPMEAVELIASDEAGAGAALLAS